MNMKTKTYKISELKTNLQQESIYGEPSPLEYQRLRENIEANGLRDRPVVTTAGVILDGHQRVKIMRELGETEIQVSVAEEMTENEEERYFLEANAVRRELDPVCRARVIKRRFELELKEKGSRLSPGAMDGEFRDRIAAEMGMSGRQASRYLQLISLPKYIQDAVSTNALPMTQAIAVDSFSNAEKKQLEKRVGDGEQVAAVVKDIRAKKSAARKPNDQFKTLSQFLQKNLTNLEKAVALQSSDIPADQAFTSHVQRLQKLLATIASRAMANPPSAQNKRSKVSKVARRYSPVQSRIPSHISDTVSE